MHKLFYKQAVCKRKAKMEKAYLRLMDRKMVTTILVLYFNGEARDNGCTVQRTEAKLGESSFSRIVT